MKRRDKSEPAEPVIKEMDPKKLSSHGQHAWTSSVKKKGEVSAKNARSWGRQVEEQSRRKSRNRSIHRRKSASTLKKR